jgi:hypothetical protein
MGKTVSNDRSHRGAVIEATARTSSYRPSREGKHILAGYFEAETVEALRKFLLRISYETGKQVSQQDAIGMGLGLLMSRHKTPVPGELQNLLPPVEEPRTPKIHKAAPDIRPSSEGNGLKVSGNARRPDAKSTLHQVSRPVKFSGHRPTGRG